MDAHIDCGYVSFTLKVFYRFYLKFRQKKSMKNQACFSLFFILLMGLIGTGCDKLSIGGDRVCTEIGCSDGISLRISGERPDTISISIKKNQETELIGSGQCTEPDQSCRLFVQGETPESITVEIGWEGEAFKDTFIPQYEEFQPNGPDCPPTCSVATVEINFSAGKE